MCAGRAYSFTPLLGASLSIAVGTPAHPTGPWGPGYGRRCLCLLREALEKADAGSYAASCALSQRNTRAQEGP
eukprot:33022-Alexandrium_andersonii.AAC.1